MLPGKKTAFHSDPGRHISRSFCPKLYISILSQARVENTEIVVVDGASTDNTPGIMREFCAKYPNFPYHRLPEKGGIDLDMAKAVELSNGEIAGYSAAMISSAPVNCRPSGKTSRAVTTFIS